MVLRVATVREKYLENEIFSRSRKSQGMLMVREIWKAREKSGNLKINGYGRQTLEKFMYSFQEGKRCTFS